MAAGVMNDEQHMATNGPVPSVPGRLPIAGHIQQWRKDPVKLLTEAARTGEVVRLGLPPGSRSPTPPA